MAFLLETLKKSIFIRLGVGQLMSLFVTGTGVCTQELQNRQASLPALQALLNYALIAVVYGGVLLTRKRSCHRPSVPWWSCALVAVADVEANVLAVKAYQYTSITSVMLLDCFSIPCVMILTFVFMKTKYALLHVLGALICISGIVVLVFSDSSKFSSESNGLNKALLGDIIVLFAAVLYSLSNVGQEAIVTKYDRYEFLWYLGVFGVLLSGVHLAVDYEALADMHFEPVSYGLLAGFVLCLFAMYSVAPYMLVVGGAALMNLSLLTSDIFAVVVDVVMFGYVPNMLSYIAFALIITGLLVYNMHTAATPAPSADAPHSAIQRADSESDESQTSGYDDLMEVASYKEKGVME